MNNNQILSRRRVVHQETAWEIRPKGAKLQNSNLFFLLFLQKRNGFFFFGLFLLSGEKRGDRHLNTRECRRLRICFCVSFISTFPIADSHHFLLLLLLLLLSFILRTTHAVDWLCRDTSTNQKILPPSIFPFAPFPKQSLQS